MLASVIEHLSFKYFELLVFYNVKYCAMFDNAWLNTKYIHQTLTKFYANCDEVNTKFLNKMNTSTSYNWYHLYTYTLLRAVAPEVIWFVI